ncbi:hypothetical protein ACRAVF_19100 [Bradyrhizobium oligotrophicum S58]
MEVVATYEEFRHGAAASKKSILPPRAVTGLATGPCRDEIFFYQPTNLFHIFDLTVPK